MGGARLFLSGSYERFDISGVEQICLADPHGCKPLLAHCANGAG
ncbi:MAG: hypothetical protein R3E21_08120 [Caenibius sp.]